MGFILFHFQDFFPRITENSWVYFFILKCKTIQIVQANGLTLKAQIYLHLENLSTSLMVLTFCFE